MKRKTISKIAVEWLFWTGIPLQLIAMFRENTMNPFKPGDERFHDMVFDTKEDVRSPAPPTEKCYINHCPYGRNNRIVVNTNRKAGINDRRAKLSLLTNIGGLFCATVHVGNPKSLLLQFHNENFPPIDPSMPWSELLEMNFKDDGSTALRTERNIHAFEAKHGQAWKRFTSQDDVELVENFWLQQRSEQTNGRFIWTLDGTAMTTPFFRHLGSYFSSRKNKLTTSFRHELPTNSSDCNFVTDNRSKKTELIATRVLNKILEEAGVVDTHLGSLHVRRTDSVDLCDSTVPTMKAYLECSLNQTARVMPSLTLLFASDEKNSSYRDSILNLPREPGSSLSHVHIVDLDASVLNVLRDMIKEGTLRPWMNNNFVVFLVVQAVQERTRFRLVRRRAMMCNECDEVSRYM